MTDDILSYNDLNYYTEKDKLILIFRQLYAIFSEVVLFPNYIINHHRKIQNCN